MSKLTALLLSLCLAVFAGNALATDDNALGKDALNAVGLQNDAAIQPDLKSDGFAIDEEGFFIDDDEFVGAPFLFRNRPFLFNDRNLLLRRNVVPRNNFFIRNPRFNNVERER